MPGQEQAHLAERNWDPCCFSGDQVRGHLCMQSWGKGEGYTSGKGRGCLEVTSGWVDRGLMKGLGKEVEVGNGPGWEHQAEELGPWWEQWGFLEDLLCTSDLLYFFPPQTQCCELIPESYRVTTPFLHLTKDRRKKIAQRSIWKKARPTFPQSSSLTCTQDLKYTLWKPSFIEVAFLWDHKRILGSSLSRQKNSTWNWQHWQNGNHWPGNGRSGPRVKTFCDEPVGWFGQVTEFHEISVCSLLIGRQQPLPSLRKEVLLTCHTLGFLQVPTECQANWDSSWFLEF